MLKDLVFYCERRAIVALQNHKFMWLTFCRICFNLLVKTAGTNFQKLQSSDNRKLGFD